MEMTFWKQMILAVLGLLFVLVVFGLFLHLREKDKKIWSWVIAILCFIVMVMSIGFFSGSQVITIEGENVKHGTWVMNFKEGDRTVSIGWEKVYIYNKGNENCNLILYPIYYTSHDKLIGTPVKDRYKAQLKELKPGELWELDKTPHIIFRKPSNKEINNRSELMYWCIDRVENVDTTTISNYRPLEVDIQVENY